MGSMLRNTAAKEKKEKLNENLHGKNSFEISYSMNKDFFFT